MSEDPFLDPLSDMESLAAKDSENLPPDMPEELKEIVKSIQGQGGNPLVKAMALVIGPDGKPRLINENTGKEDTESPGIPSELADLILNAVGGTATKGPNPSGQLVALMNEMLTTVNESSSPENLFKELGWTGSMEEANAMFEDMTKIILKAGRGVFKEHAFRRLYAETDLFESVTFHTQMMFLLGYYMKGKEQVVRTSSEGAVHQNPDPSGDPGGDRTSG